MNARVGHVVALAMLVSLLFAAAPTAAAPALDAGAFAPGQVLVQYAPGTTARAQAAARARVGGVRIELIRGSAASGDLELVRLPRGLAVAEAVRALGADPNVRFAEPNWRYTHQATTSDPDYTNGSLWGMYGNSTSPANQYGSQAGEAWTKNQTGIASVVIGVIDTGVDIGHPDLNANVWMNPNEIAGNGLDDDGNGYADDVNGWDFYHDDATVYDAADGDDHGTHVAGTIGAESDGAGVVGVSWDVTIVSAKFLGPDGGYTSDAVRAVDYLTDLKSRGFNVVASSNSWGGGGYSQALHDAIIRGAKADVLFVAAAGNDGTNNDRRSHYPSNYRTSVGTTTESAASYDAVIAVAAIASDGTKPRWSNYGARTVDLGAPGVGVRSTLPNATYGSYSGTSMATPHVTGGAALYSAATGYSGKAVRDAILSATIPTASMSRKTVTGGRLNLGDF